MKKCILVLLSALSLTISGCAETVSKEDYDALSETLDSFRRENEQLRTSNKRISDEFVQYKESMAYYETLSDEQVQLLHAKEAEEAALKESEEQAGFETGITYDQLARNPDDYKQKKVKFRGRVLQVIENNIMNELRLAVDGDSDKVLYVNYSSSLASSRILKGDTITVYGTASGIKTYTTIMGASVSVPNIYTSQIDQ